MQKANQDIREYMADHGVTQQMLADKFGVSLYAMNKRLKTELLQPEKELFLNQIDVCAEQICEAAQDSIHEAEDQSCGTKFQIGDRVKIPSKANKVGIVSDIWHSQSKDCVMYAVEDEKESHCGLYAEDQLEAAPVPTSYSFDAVIEGNVAVVTMKATMGDNTWVYARGHAHILHNGEVGMAQAVSFAAKRMFESLDKQQENKIYVKEVR